MLTVLADKKESALSIVALWARELIDDIAEKAVMTGRDNLIEVLREAI